MTVGTVDPLDEVMAVRYASFRHGRAMYHEVRLALEPGRTRTEVKFLSGTAPLKTFTASAEPPALVINGTFFHPQSGWPIADVVEKGRLRATGNRGSAFGVTYEGDIQLFDQNYGRSIDWSAFEYGVRGLVRVMSGGKIAPNPKAQRFRDARIWGRASRVAAGISTGGRVRFFATSSQVTLSELGAAMKSRGVVDAVAFDGGSSAGMIYRGKTLVRPARKVSNALRVFETGTPGPPPPRIEEPPYVPPPPPKIEEPSYIPPPPPVVR